MSNDRRNNRNTPENPTYVRLVGRQVSDPLEKHFGEFLTPFVWLVLFLFLALQDLSWV
jgi:hypothetical protein